MVAEEGVVAGLNVGERIYVGERSSWRPRALCGLRSDAFRRELSAVQKPVGGGPRGHFKKIWIMLHMFGTRTHVTLMRKQEKMWFVQGEASWSAPRMVGGDAHRCSSSNECGNLTRRWNWWRIRPSPSSSGRRDIWRKTSQNSCDARWC